MVLVLGDLCSCLQESCEPVLAEKGDGHLGGDCWPESQPSPSAAQSREFLSERIPERGDGARRPPLHPALSSGPW